MSAPFLVGRGPRIRVAQPAGGSGASEGATLHGFDDQTITAGAAAATVLFPAVDDDTGSYTATSDSVTTPRDGIYRVSSGIRSSADAGNRYQAVLVANGSRYLDYDVVWVPSDGSVGWIGAAISLYYEGPLYFGDVVTAEIDLAGVDEVLSERFLAIEYLRPWTPPV